MFKCEYKECENREFNTTLGLGIHVKFTHRVSKQEYAKIFRTKEWVTCYICGKEFYKMINSQKRFDENGKCICACCKACGQKLANIFSTITKTKAGVHKLIQIKAQKTKRERGTDSVGATKAAVTKHKNGYYGSEKHKSTLVNWIEAGREAARQPEARERAKQTILKNGGYAPIIERGRQTTYKKFGKRTTWRPSYSLESQVLFKSVEQKLIEIFKDIKVYYATKHHEFQIVQNRHHAFLDFYVPSLNKIIEFDEEYHKKHGQEEKDIIREDLILSYFDNNISILRIKKEDFLKDKQKIIDQCVSFILDPVALSIFLKRNNKFETLSIGCRK
jgi:very-short-patch-repair endonuclease